MAPLAIVNIPNILTIIRILLVPVFLFLVTRNELYSAAAVFALAGVTDAMDGFIARTFSSRTDLGTTLDPFADKLLLTSSYIALTVKGLVPVWLCVPVIFREILILAGVTVLRGTGRKVIIQPSMFGKLTTFFQISMVLYAMIFAGKSGNAVYMALALLTAILTVYTCFDYAWREFKIQTKRP